MGKRIEIFHKNGLYQILPDLDVYQCVGCNQGYWWSDRPNSSASRIKNAVSYLFQLALDYGVSYNKNDINTDMFDFLNMEQKEDIKNIILKQKQKNEKKEFNNINKEILS